MKVSKYLLFAAFALPLLLSACRGQKFKQQPIHPNMNMDQQRRFEPQEENDFFADHRAMRQPVAGTIARGHLKHNKPYYQGINKDSTFVKDIPVDVTKSFIYRGKDRFEIYCTPCHGVAGDGQGIIMTGGYGYVPAPSFHQPRLRNVNDGYIFSAISNGIRNMPSYAHQIPVKDRWAIVSYVRALQRSQNVGEQEIKKFDVDLAALQNAYKEKQAEAKAKEEAKAAAGGGEVSAEKGRTIAENNACLTCHSTDGSKMTGPTWQNLFGHEVELDDGSTVTADEDYLTESIVNSQAKVVNGFAPVMPNYDYLSDSDVESLVAYIKSLSEANAETEGEGQQSSVFPVEKKIEATEKAKTSGRLYASAQPIIDAHTPAQTDTLSTSAQEGKKLVQEYKCLSCHTIDENTKEDLAPSFAGLYGSKRPLKDGTYVVADDGYIKESIQYPGAKIALGYNENMLSYRDLLTDSQLESIVDYIKTLR